ncbi:MAG: formylglycine-generating enzyme family protein [Bacteroidales bacterium]|nr:formylglycine-generating enzyme family protein [Bacteroidales bacterium]
MKDVSFTMVYVEGGETVIGRTSEQDSYSKISNDPKQVTLDSYWIGQTEVTQELWEAVMGDNPSKDKSDPKLPVTNISWDDCNVFITRLSGLTGERFRMLTEAEWEYAARGGMYSKYYKFSGSNDAGEVGWCDGKKHPVATKKANELGLYDMTGNAYEWCKNGTYKEVDFLPGGNNPQGRNAPYCGYAIIRDFACSCVAFRYSQDIKWGGDNNGLRIARSVKKVVIEEE